MSIFDSSPSSFFNQDSHLAARSKTLELVLLPLNFGHARSGHQVRSEVTTQKLCNRVTTTGCFRKSEPLTKIVNISLTMHPTALGGLSFERAANFRPDRLYADLNLSQNAATIFDDK